MFGAKRYLYQQHLSLDTPCRFDVISIYKENITWIQNAFELIWNKILRL